MLWRQRSDGPANQSNLLSLRKEKEEKKGKKKDKTFYLNMERCTNLNHAIKKEVFKQLYELEKFEKTQAMGSLTEWKLWLRWPLAESG